MQIIDSSNSDVTFAPGPASRFQWVASGPNPCKRCAELDGQVRTLSAWESSVQPGLHKHCRCKLVCVEANDSGMAFAYQFGHLGIMNIDGSISEFPLQPGPQHLSKKNREEAEGAEDVAPYVSPTRDYSTKEYDNSDGGDQYSNRGV
jgi:hypothetical protein